jgi:hypothetical protein
MSDNTRSHYVQYLPKCTNFAIIGPENDNGRSYIRKSPPPKKNRERKDCRENRTSIQARDWTLEKLSSVGFLRKCRL